MKKIAAFGSLLLFLAAVTIQIGVTLMCVCDICPNLSSFIFPLTLLFPPSNDADIHRHLNAL